MIIERNKKKYLNNKGITIIEMLLYMGLLSILLVILTDMFVGVLNIRASSQATSYLEQDGKYILSKLIYDINNTDSITTPATPGSITNSLTIVTNGIDRTYTISGEKLQFTDNTGTYDMNGSETQIQNISFQRIGSANRSTIKLQFDVVSKIQTTKGYETKTYKTTVGIR